MPDSYVFTGKDGMERTFIGDRPPTSDEMASIERGEAKSSSPKAALVMAGTAAAVPAATTAAEMIATSPTLARTASSAANSATTLAGVLHGTATMNPAEVLAASKAGWGAGKGAYFLTKNAQSVAAPIANALEKAAPYVQTLSTLAGAQGVNDLAQMAEPSREDIGVLGLGGSGRAADQAAVMRSQINDLIKTGIPPGEASRQVYNAWAKFLKDQRSK